MKPDTEQENLCDLSHGEKQKLLFRRQKELLDMFLGTRAITQAQYDKSLGDLRLKMGMDQPEKA